MRKIMTETKYHIARPKARLPVRTLVTLPYKETTLTVAFPTFGSNYFSANIREMKRRHEHPETGEIIYFREPTTSESIAIISYALKHQSRVLEFNEVLAAIRTKKELFQLGLIVRTSEGIYTNPPKDTKGNIITDEKILKNDLKIVKPLRVG